MDESQHTLLALLWAAAILGVTHTIVGPDHYLPFVAIARARNWGAAKTLIATAICGSGHVLSSLVIGLVGVAIGSAVGHMEAVESLRGDIVKWLFLGVALAYTVYGIKSGINCKIHTHANGVIHAHGAMSESQHARMERGNYDFWVMFIIFVFGPCEVLIPLVMGPAANSNWIGVALISLVFSLSTIITMLIAVSALLYGLKLSHINFANISRWNHALIGGILLFCAGLMFAGL